MLLLRLTALTFENRVNSRFELKFIFTHFLESEIIDGSELDFEDKSDFSWSVVLVLTVLTLLKKRRYHPHKWIHDIYFGHFRRDFITESIQIYCFLSLMAH